MQTNRINAVAYGRYFCTRGVFNRAYQGTLSAADSGCDASLSIAGGTGVNRIEGERAADCACEFVAGADFKLAATADICLTAGNRANTRGASSIVDVDEFVKFDGAVELAVVLRRRGLTVEGGLVMRFAFLWRCGYRPPEVQP
jgi:hypothetical protein